MIRAVAILLVSASLAGSTAAQSPRQREVTSEVELRPTASDLSAIELQIPDAASGRIARRPLSDFLLRLRRPSGDILAALAHSEDAPVDRETGLMQAQLYLVTQGRLTAPVEARCDRWFKDFALCAVHCDGGYFGVARTAGKPDGGLALVIGRLPRGADDMERPVVRLDACAASSASEVELAASQKRPVARIELRRAR